MPRLLTYLRPFSVAGGDAWLGVSSNLTERRELVELERDKDEQGEIDLANGGDAERFEDVVDEERNLKCARNSISEVLWYGCGGGGGGTTMTRGWDVGGFKRMST